jgi:hypothetical protein
MILVIIQLEDLHWGTYGLGITDKSSKDDVRGTCARTDGEKGRAVPKGLSGRRPACRSLKDTGGAKSRAVRTESAFRR